MRIPLHWSKATAEESDQKGRKASFTCWRSSDASRDDARQSALVAAKRALQRFVENQPLGRYPYGCGDVPLREEVVQRFEDSQEELYAAVTRNAYGSLVLNSARAMFIDIDFPEPESLSLWETLRNLFFGRATPAPEVQEEEEKAKSRLERFVRERGDWSVRIYRTLAGVRGFVTHDLFDPASDTAMDILKTVGADPLYVRLCRAQACFRARLTPKPWRCGHCVNRTVWPREGEEQERAFRKWLAGYMSNQGRFAKCRYLGTLGPGTVHPEIETIIEVHDEITRCHEPLDLA